MQSNKEELKKTLLDMLLEDKEFRHAVAGAIGYKEILDRFARVEEEIKELRRDMDARFLKVEEEIKSLREETKALREEANNLRKETSNLRKDMNDLRRDMQEGFRRHDEEFARVWKSIEAMRKDMQEGFKRMDKRLSYIESFMDNISVSIEDEARDMVAYLLKQKGITLNIRDLTLPDLEIDIYAVDTDYCIVGEAKTRAVRKAILQVEKDIARLCKKYPSYTRGKVIKVVYAIRAMPDAVEEARSRGIWLVTARGELTELKI
ncbi:MAG: hypothetical protein QXU29_05935 [Candidatus Nitrosocaldus sp.]